MQNMIFLERLNKWEHINRDSNLRTNVGQDRNDFKVKFQELGVIKYKYEESCNCWEHKNTF